ncbi:NGG1p interacting factor NIF3 [Psychromonas antarctica]|jgi:structural hemagglutinin/hemolysin toxin protein RtxA|uniref:NGG1p interacting factor NIF3 n=1 Tax=Psychromonas antarctica TaxID=67573 RepID=UPI001EE8BE7E|nr:NGG1p interacting factor NIF3 [Psychromonas antarctica]MCG6201284.1 NGG1p interacting factor NIF3 [Psychromonas antarctica]
MYQLVFYVPVSHLEMVKSAVFKAGAGSMGDYESCAWQCLGTGQFRPLAASTPFIGIVDQVQKVPEYKVEMVCIAAKIKPILQALLAAHPYQTPAYSVIEIKTIKDF